MADVLVFVENHEGTLVSSSLGVVVKARELASELGGDVVAVIAGGSVRDQAASLAAYGAGRVLVAEGDRFAHPVAGPVVDVIEAAVKQVSPRVLLASASVLGAEAAGALAARLDVGVNADGIDIAVRDGELVFRRPALGDSVHVECTWSGGDDGFAGIALFRANTFPATPVNGSQANVEALQVADAAGAGAVEFLGVEQAQTGGVDITQADVLVGAGRGLGSPDNFHIVESLAQAIGGAVATTRAVVDAGWYDYSTQVGQTGKTVSPKLYLAVGISGAIQHKIGMQSADTIVAINKDPNAPIFEYAHFGVVGDLFQIVPKLEEEIRKRRGT